MKKLCSYSVYAFVCILIGTTPSSAQGWIGNGSNSLYARNASLQLTPIYVGIGTNAPTAQLHTTGSVRFAGLTNSNQPRMLVSDTSGNLYYRNISSIAGSGWMLTGNTPSSSNFIGTTNNQDFRIRTNNVQRMVVSGTGNVGINNATPHYKLSISGNTDGSETYDGRRYIDLVNKSTAYTSAVSIQFQAGSNDSLFGAVAYTANTYTYQPNSTSILHLFANGNGVQVSSISKTGTIRLATNVNPQNVPIERMRVTANGNVGINTQAPTAKLHTNGTVRFENLPVGSGTSLVIDADGNVYRSTASPSETVSDSNDVQKLREEVAMLKGELEALKAAVISTQGKGLPGGAAGAKLYQNAPNPFSSSTLISYYLPESIVKAECVIYDMNGREKKRIQVKGRGNGNFSIDNLPAGIYMCTLYADGRFVDSKKMSSGR